MDFLSLLRAEREKAKKKDSNGEEQEKQPQQTAAVTSAETSPSTAPVFCLSSLRPSTVHQVAEHVQYIPDFLSTSEESALPVSYTHLTLPTKRIV